MPALVCWLENCFILSDYITLGNCIRLKNKGIKVLIVDDEIDICYLLSSILRQQHIVTSYVNTLSDATVALKNDIPDMLFLDNHLPDGLGIEYIRYVKNSFPEVKIVMITAHDSVVERNRALQDGADFFISKPFSREIIYSTVDKLILQHPM
jgi:two-component system OmpR family response regulator